MFSIAQLLDAAKSRANIDSDYRLAKVIGITHAGISNYRMGKSLPNESTIEQLCALSGDDPDVIAAQIQAARSKSPEAKTMWLRVAARMAGRIQPAILAALFAIALIAGFAIPARSSESVDAQSGKVNSLYIVSITFLAGCEFLRSRLRQFQLLLRFWCLSFW